MNNQLLFLTIKGYDPDGGAQFEDWRISYQVFGKKLGTAPVILVNHALTGNSDLASETKGWWRAIIGPDKLLNTNRFSIIGFNIPGNGYDDQLISNYKSFTARDIARVFNHALEQLGVKELFAAIGGSLGGGIAWEQAVLRPNFINYLIPVASDWKASDWIIGHNYIQDAILQNSNAPLEQARMMAMLFYRTPASLSAKFNRTKVEGSEEFNVASWLQHHGDKLNRRFALEAYQLMNHLLTTVDVSKGKISFNEAVKNLKSTIIQVAVDSDFFFAAEENRQTKVVLDEIGISNEYHEISSIHGHDAFLIEAKQITNILTPIFKN